MFGRKLSSDQNKKHKAAASLFNRQKSVTHQRSKSSKTIKAKNIGMFLFYNKLSEITQKTCRVDIQDDLNSMCD